MRISRGFNTTSHCRTENGYPLNIEVATLKYEASPVNKDFLLKLLPKLNYPAFHLAVQQLLPHCADYSLPAIPNDVDTSDIAAIDTLDNDTIAALHTWLLDVYLVEGSLICPDTARKFPVKDCIPNMILHEDEI